MAQVQNQYTGDGSTVLFSFTFPYIETTDIKVSLDGVATTEYTLANATTIEFNVAPADGAAILIRRQTESDELKATFFPGSAIRAQDLNDNFEQGLFVAQETTQEATDAAESARLAGESAAAAEASAAQAEADATTAITTANQASSDVAGAIADAAQAATDASNAATSASNAAQSASDAAASAVGAQTTADAAVDKANDAEAIALGIEGKADSAIDIANTATITANNAEGVAQTALDTSVIANDAASQALTVANNIDGKADFAIATAENAEDIAQDALDAVSGASPWIGDASSVHLTDSSKSVGIGTSAPNTKLDVVDGVINTDNSLATNNQVRIGADTNTAYAAYMSYGQPSAGGPYRLSIQSYSDTTSPIVLNYNGGNVGVNEEYPDTPLHVTGGPITLDSGGNNGYSRTAIFRDDVNFGTQLRDSNGNFVATTYAVSHDAAGAKEHKWYTGPSSEKMRLTGNGNLGIGVSSPSERLVLADVAEPTGFSDTALSMIRSNYGGRIAGYLDQGVGHGITFDTIDQATPTERMRITNAGFVGIGTSTPGQKLVVSEGGAQGLEFNPFTSDRFVLAGYNRATSNYIQLEYEGTNHLFKSGTSEKMRLTSDGKLGIGRSDPAQKLDVEGHGRISTGSTGYGLLQFGDDPNSFDNYHLGGDGGGGFQLYNGNIGSGISLMQINSDGDTSIVGKLGIGLTNPEAGLVVRGADQNNFTAITDSGALDGFVKVLGLGTSPGAGGGVLFGAEQSYIAGSAGFAAIKGQLTDGGGNTRGDLAFFTRGDASDTELQQRMRIDHTGSVTITGNLTVGGTINGTTGGGGGAAATGYTNVKTDFGAIGNGTTDDTAAINNALQAGGAVYFPAGTYRVTSQITVTNKALHMYGDGQASRILFDPGTSGTNFLDLRYNDGTPNPSQAYAISNLVIHAKQNKVCGFGVRLYFTGSTTLVGVCNKLTLTNVDIGSEFTSDANTGYFKVALKMLNSAGVVGTNLNIYTNSKTKVEYGVTDSVGIDIENSMAGHAMIRTLYLNNFYIQRYHTGIRAYSSAGNSYNSLESLYLSQGELLASKALRMERMAAITVVGIHSDVRDYFFDSSNTYGDVHYASTVRIVGNDIRANRVDGEDVTTQDYLFKIKGQQTLITGNNIMSFKNTQGIIQTGGNPANQINTVITGNHFSGNGSATFKALRCESGSRQVTYGGNTLESFGGNLSPISNSVGSELSVYGQRAGNTV